MSLLLLALAPSAAIIQYVYHKDKHEKEPRKMLLLAFLLGIVSVIPAIIGSEFGSRFFEVSPNPIMTFAYAFGVVALSEELAKFFFLRFVMYKKKDFNEPYDGIIYSVMVSMGFATFENIMYVYQSGVGTGILRMFTAVPAHAVFGIAMGYFVGLAKFSEHNSNWLALRGLIIAVMLHGAYDFFLFQNNIPALAFLSFLGLVMGVRWSRSAIKLHQARSPFKQNNDIA